MSHNNESDAAYIQQYFLPEKSHFARIEIDALQNHWTNLYHPILDQAELQIDSETQEDLHIVYVYFPSPFSFDLIILALDSRILNSSATNFDVWLKKGMDIFFPNVKHSMRQVYTELEHSTLFFIRDAGLL